MTQSSKIASCRLKTAPKRLATAISESLAGKSYCLRAALKSPLTFDKSPRAAAKGPTPFSKKGRGSWQKGGGFLKKEGGSWKKPPPSRLRMRRLRKNTLSPANGRGTG
jgi:hypothetical protein